MGEVNAWCTAVQAPEPTATSPAATASPAGSNIGASTTHTNANASWSIRPRRSAISSRAAPRSARELLASPAAKNTQSPGSAPTFAASPAFSSSEMFLETGPVRLPSSWTSTYARPLAPRCLAHSCQPSSVRRGWEAPPFITTAPTYGAWNTRKGVEAKYSVISVISRSKRRSGLSEPKRRMDSS